MPNRFYASSTDRARSINELVEMLATKPGEVKAIAIGSDQPDDGLFQLCSSVLTSSEQNDCSKFVRPHDQCVASAMRGLWKIGAASLLRCPVQEIRYVVDEYGRPLLSGQSRQEIDLNTTRTSYKGFSMIGVVVSRAGMCGIDIEAVDPKLVDSQVLKELHIDESEYEWYLREPELFFQRWVQMEAVIKAEGRGFSNPRLPELHSESLATKNERPQRGIWRLDGQIWTTTPIHLPDGVVGSCGTSTVVDVQFDLI